MKFEGNVMIEEAIVAIIFVIMLLVTLYLSFGK